MATNRRGFLKLAGLGLATASVGRAQALGAGALSRPAGVGRLAILQGPSDATSASFLVQHVSEGAFGFRVRGDAGDVRVATIERFDPPGQPVVVTELLATGLVPGVTYVFEVTGPDGHIIDARTFKAFDTARTDLRFAIGSCMNDRFLDTGAGVWAALAAFGPDAVFLIGDTVYSDQLNWSKDEAGYARRYFEARDRLPWFRSPHLVPTFATWDDHDFGQNDGDKSFARAPFLRTLFRRYFGGVDNAAWKRAHGVGSVLRAGGQRFYLLDDRSFRDAKRTQQGRHLGDLQREWLLADLASSNEPAWLLNGSQFFGGYHGVESYEADHAHEFKETLAKLSRLSAPVMFASGDIHISEVMEIESAHLGYRTYELTSSSMHSFVVPFMDGLVKNPRRLVSEWRYNFLAVESRVTPSWQADVRCVTADGVSFAKSLEVVRG